MRRIGILSWSAAVLVFAVGCGSEQASNPGPGGAGGSGGGPVTDAGSNPGTTPCNLHTGYEGDDLCILPPDPSKGLQLHFGPKNYDDPEEIKKYILMPGEERTECIALKTPNEVEVFHAEYHGRMRPGSHHMLVFTQSADLPDSATPERCTQGLDTAMIMGGQTPTIDIDRNQHPAPENDGLAQRLAPRAQAVFQLHYLNSTSKPMLREAWANVIYSDPSTVKIFADPIWFLAGIAAVVPPNTKRISKGQATAPYDVRLIGATGHYHSHTVRFSAWSIIGGERKQIFEDYDWHDPKLFTFDSVEMNSPWDAADKRPGAVSGILNLKPGDRIEWECEVVNDSNVTLTFGDAVHTGEMCNMFGYYAPSIGRPWSATNF